MLYIGNIISGRGGTPTTIETLAPLLRKEGFAVKTASNVKNKIGRLYDMVRSLYQNRKWADYVLIDTYSTQNFIYAILIGALCSLFRIRYIPILHGGNLPNRLKDRTGAARFFFKNAYSNVSPSRYLYEIFSDYGLDNLAYISNSIQIDQFPFKRREELRCRLLWVRSFSSIYNPELALEVLSVLLKKFPEAELCMVGPAKDDSLDHCKAIAKEKNLPVLFPGKLDRKEIATLSSDYDIFLNTARTDNTPVSLIEIMALGLPIVSTKVGGIPYLVADQTEAILVSPDNAQEMADAVENLTQEPGKALQISLAAREKAIRMDWENVKNYWNKLLNN